MSTHTDKAVRTSGRSGARDLDAGLRAYMLKIYNYMALGLGITGVIAYFVASTPVLLQSIINSPVFIMLFVAQLGAVLFLSMRIEKMSTKTAQLTFWGYAALTGLTLAVYFAAFTYESIARVFFITAGTFGAMSLYGYTTKRDLTGFGSFLFMGVIGLIIASVANLFIQSSMIVFLTSVLGVLIFTGLTAYDTQKLKQMYYHVGHTAVGENYAVLGALQLYLDFIIIFKNLLHLLGDRR